MQQVNEERFNLIKTLLTQAMRFWLRCVSVMVDLDEMIMFFLFMQLGIMIYKMCLIEIIFMTINVLQAKKLIAVEIGIVQISS
jgi:hypothetical protein